jgi:hypothetical protein
MIYGNWWRSRFGNLCALLRDVGRTVKDSKATGRTEMPNRIRNAGRLHYSDTWTDLARGEKPWRPKRFNLI